jgi:hypothetical protein
MEKLLTQPKFRMLGLEINGCPIELGMEVDKSTRKRCGLRRNISGIRSWLGRNEKSQDLVSINCFISCFGGDLRIGPYSKFFPYRLWLKTRVLFTLEDDTLTALLIDFWSDGSGGVAQGLLDRFEELSDTWATRTFDRGRAAKMISSQELMDAYLNNVNLRPHGEWEINNTCIYSDLRGRRDGYHPRGLCRIMWEIKGDTTRFMPSDLFC